MEKHGGEREGHGHVTERNRAQETDTRGTFSSAEGYRRAIGTPRLSHFLRPDTGKGTSLPEDASEEPSGPPG